MSNANNVFQSNCHSILSLIRCADVTALHVIAASRKVEPNISLINRIIMEGGTSNLVHSWRFFMTRDEYTEFDEKGHIRAAAEHIVMASYVAIEAYLKEKLIEFCGHLKPNVEVFPIKLRNLSEIRKYFKKYVKMNIAKFDHPAVSWYEEADWISPSNCWGVLLRLENFRNEVAHEGNASSANLVTLVDAWSAYNFVTCYGKFFELCYNQLIYEGKPVKFEIKS